MCAHEFSFEKLVAWQEAKELTMTIYQETKSFPSDERFGLTQQIRRAVMSVCANIAEGSSRNSDKDYARFLQLSLGSAFEVQTYLTIAKEMNWTKSEGIIEIELLLEEEIKMIHRFINTLNKANS